MSALWSGWYIWKWDRWCCWKAGSLWVWKQQTLSLNHNFLFFIVLLCLQDFIVTSFISLFYVVKITHDTAECYAKLVRNQHVDQTGHLSWDFFFLLSFLPVSMKHNEKKRILQLALFIHYANHILAEDMKQGLFNQILVVSWDLTNPMFSSTFLVLNIFSSLVTFVFHVKI